MFDASGKNSFFIYVHLRWKKIADNVFPGILFRQWNVESFDESSSSSFVEILWTIGRTDNKDSLFSGRSGAILLNMNLLLEHFTSLEYYNDIRTNNIKRIFRGLKSSSSTKSCSSQLFVCKPFSLLWFVHTLFWSCLLCHALPHFWFVSHNLETG